MDSIFYALNVNTNTIKGSKKIQYLSLNSKNHFQIQFQHFLILQTNIYETV